MLVDADQCFLQVTIEDYMSEFEGGAAAPAPDAQQLAAQLSGPWMKALLAGEDEAEGTDLFSALAPPAPAPPAPGEAPEQLPNLPVILTPLQGWNFSCAAGYPFSTFGPAMPHSLNASTLRRCAGSKIECCYMCCMLHPVQILQRSPLCSRGD